MNRINAPADFKQAINCVYPPNNFRIFEEWFMGESRMHECDTDRLYIDVNFTGYLVNHNYAEFPNDVPELQELIDCLPRDKKYFCICQYDHGVVVDFKDLDVLQFNMSKKIGVEMPLLCQPHPYAKAGNKKYLANFVGSKTHPIRNHLELLKDKPGYYISFEFGSIEAYCQILDQSLFTLCPRGFGANSFRICEAMQYGSIPVYISDEFILPYGADFNQFGILIHSDEVHRIDDILTSIPESVIIEKQDMMPQYYFNYYTYNSNLNHIKRCLETEYHKRKRRENDAATTRIRASEN